MKVRFSKLRMLQLYEAYVSYYRNSNMSVICKFYCNIIFNAVRGQNVLS